MVRREAGLAGIDLGAPMDVLWLRLSRRPGDPRQSLGRAEGGRMMVLLDRGDYWQCAFLTPKGGFDALCARHRELRRRAEGARPGIRRRLGEIGIWDDMELLTVAVDRLERWYRPGLLCIGDAAHAMSPIGSVGINLAIQDAVAPANILKAALERDGAVSEAPLAAVQRRRELPTRLTQSVQLLIQNRVISRVIAGGGALRLPLALRPLRCFPCCDASRRGSSAWASGRSMCAGPRAAVDSAPAGRMLDGEGGPP